MNWDSAEERAGLIERVGIREYNRLFAIYLEKITVKVNGYGIRPMLTPFGRLFAVMNGEGRAFATQVEAESYAKGLPAVN